MRYGLSWVQLPWLANALKDLDKAMIVYQQVLLPQKAHGNAIVEMRREADVRARDIEVRIEKLISDIGERLCQKGARSEARNCLYP